MKAFRTLILAMIILFAALLFACGLGTITHALAWFFMQGWKVIP